jgi:hypothetical protein
MGYSSRKYGKQAEERPWKVHPVWRGIGCFMAIIMPIMAWAGADLFLQTNNFVPLPPELYRQVSLPATNAGTVDALTRAINGFLVDMGVTWGMIFFTLVFLFLGYGVLSILYSLMYRVAGPPRYGEFDSRPMPAPKRRR